MRPGFEFAAAWIPYWAVQATAGTELAVPGRPARNPKVAEAPAPRLPFQLRFFAVTELEVCATVAFQLCVMVWPSAKVNPTVQPETPPAPAVIVTEA